MATKSAAEKEAEKAAKASEKVLKKLTELGVTDLTGQETLPELEARLQVAVDAAKVDQKVKKAKGEVPAFSATGKFEVVRQGEKYFVFNDLGQHVGTHEGLGAERTSGEFALRSNKLIGK